MKFGDQVLFLAEDGTEVPATVLNARVLDDHVGADGQPLLDLGYFKQVLDGQGNPKNVIGTSAQLELVQIKHDVAHESHTFEEKGKDRYPGGRWTEMPSASYFTGTVAEGEDEEEPAESSTDEEPEEQLDDESEEPSETEAKPKGKKKSKGKKAAEAES